MVVEEVLPNLHVCTPHLPLAAQESELAQREALARQLLERLLVTREVSRPTLWFYTPMALTLAVNIEPALVVYDCMDELSAFRGAPPELVAREHELLKRADLVFTGGQSLFEAKRDQHPAIRAFPSSVDAQHFASARVLSQEPPDQRSISGERLGFFGVIDERMDLELLAALARARPNYQLVMIGPVVKISEADLPRADNIHYLGPKTYAELPAYIAGWKVALMPFALNESTRFISPTKTLEYMAAGKPIVSTAIRDVVLPYGESGMVHIADERSFPQAVDVAAATERDAYLAACDRILERTSWDATWFAMAELLSNSTRDRRGSTHERDDDSCSTT
jgi:UDP-galactopyranose mutase